MRTRCDNINVTEVCKGEEEKCVSNGRGNVVKERMDRAGAAHVESNGAIALIEKQAWKNEVAIVTRRPLQC